MSLKLKVQTNFNQDGTPQAANPSARQAATPTPASAGPKLKLKASAPATEPSSAAAAPVAKKPRALNSKKRAATNDITPAAKRVANGAGGPLLSRKLSIKIGSNPPTPVSAGGSNRIRLGVGSRHSSVPKIRSINVSRPPPPRIPGMGYDSEDSEAEDDPAIQQGFILRMLPGEDCKYLREAIANNKIGMSLKEGGADVSLRFIDQQFRRAVVTVRGRNYAAALVDLPCVVETMKSWDRKGWWKVTDVWQMLLVLGRCNTDEEARNYELPKEVDKDSLQFPHGLTPPMQWVRKRRFRKRASYKDMANVEEEVERLLRDDDEAVRNGGHVTSEILDRAEAERERSDGYEDEDDEDVDAEGEAIETVEREYYESEHDEDEDMADLEGDLQAMFDNMDADDQNQGAAGAPPVASTTAITQQTAPLADQGPSMAAIENAREESVAATPADAAQTPTSGEDEQSDEDEDDDDDDDDDDEDSPDVMDEDAQQRAAERAQQLEEVADLEKEVQTMRGRTAAMKNQLLKGKMLMQLGKLEEELRTKKAVFGLEEDD